jgi:tetratricopeptide (TPR) repeat protein
MMQLIVRSSEKMIWAILVLLLSHCPVSASNAGIWTYDWHTLQKSAGAYDRLNSNASYPFPTSPNGYSNAAITDRIRNQNLAPSKAMTHYCLGNTYSKSGQKEQALREYAAALRCSNNDVLSLYCHQAIAAWLSPPSQNCSLDSRENAIYQSYKELAHIPIRTGDVKVDRVIDTIESEGVQLNNYHHWGLQDEVKKTQFKQEVQDFERVVSNSRNKFNNGSAPDLDLVGTNLYVRHYANSMPDVNPTADAQELVATQERLVLEAHNRAGKTISRVVPESDEHKPQSNSDLKVHGRVMP